jgi:hypothetical protein
MIDMYKRKKQAIEDDMTISRRESYEETMKRLSKESDVEKHSNYWKHSAARHAQELERAEERIQQAELASSMKAEVVNNAPIDELKQEIQSEAFDEALINDIRETLLAAIGIIEDVVDEYIDDETPIRVASVLSVKQQLLWVMDAHEKIGK